MPRVIFSTAASVELLDALEWYDRQAPDMVRALSAEVDKTLVRIEGNPFQFPCVHQDLRRAGLNRFPYGLIFRVDDVPIRVIAFFHDARDPNQWKSRR